MPKTTYARGDRIFVTLRLKNVSDHDVRESHERYESPMTRNHVKVQNADQRDVPFTLYGKELRELETRPGGSSAYGSIAGHELKPGEFVEEKILLTNYFDLSLSGEYVIWTKRGVKGPGGWMSAVSNKVEFTIRDEVTPEK